MQVMCGKRQQEQKVAALPCGWSADFMPEYAVKQIVFTDETVEINACACANFYNLQSVVFGKNITKIGYSAFYQNKCLTHLKFTENEKTVLEIGEGAFAYCTALEEITLPRQVQKILYGTFEGCKKLKKVRLPENLVSISSEAFLWCESLSDFDLPKGLKSVGAWAFQGCPCICAFVLPESVEKIGAGAFNTGNPDLEIYATEKQNGLLLNSGVPKSQIIITQPKQPYVVAFSREKSLNSLIKGAVRI